jgi:hypothetical protein
MANLEKAAEKGSTSWAMALPAMKVPPQKTDISSNFT